MEKDEICVKIMPISPSGPRRCGVCDELLVIPPIYSCKSVSFICGPCFEGYRYYLDDDELRAADNPVRQILYENFASRFLFHCSYFPHCKSQMAFHHEAKIHYRENCIAKVFWIFKCPIARANRWYLRPNQHYCQWRFTRISLFDKEIEKLMKHVRFLHSEYILERPHVLNLKDLLQHDEPRQLFLLLLEENGIIAVLMTEITKSDVIFRCRVSDPEWMSRSNDPYECCITLIPPHDRFRSVIDVKFDCLPLDSNEIEYPWNSLRLPIRHFVAETAFQINIFPRSVMLQTIPYLHRFRQLCCLAEEETKCSSEATLSNPESLRTDFELLSIPSTNSDYQTIDSRTTIPEPWDQDEVEREPLSINEKEGLQSIENNRFEDCSNQCQQNIVSSTVFEKPITRRATDSVFVNRPIKEDVHEIIEEMKMKTSTNRNIFGNDIMSDSNNTSSKSKISNSPLAVKIPEFSIPSSNIEKPPEGMSDYMQAFKDVFNNKNEYQENIKPTSYEMITNGITAAGDFDCFSTLSINLDDPAIQFRIPSPGESKNIENNIDNATLPENLKQCDCTNIIKDGALKDVNNECHKNDTLTTSNEKVAFGATSDFEFLPISPSECSPIDFEIPSLEHWENSAWISLFHNTNEDNIPYTSNYGSVVPILKEITTDETTAEERLRNEGHPSTVEEPGTNFLRKSSTSENLPGKTDLLELKCSSSEALLQESMLFLEDFELLSIYSSSLDEPPQEFETTTSEEWNSEGNDEVSKRSSPRTMQDVYNAFEYTNDKYPMDGDPISLLNEFNGSKTPATAQLSGKNVQDVIKDPMDSTKSSISKNHTDIKIQIGEKQSNNHYGIKNNKSPIITMKNVLNTDSVQEEHNYVKQSDEIKCPQLENKNQRSPADKTAIFYSSTIDYSADVISKRRNGKATKIRHVSKHTK